LLRSTFTGRCTDVQMYRCTDVSKICTETSNIQTVCVIGKREGCGGDAMKICDKITRERKGDRAGFKENCRRSCG
jgi:hypothetical protein